MHPLGSGDHLASVLARAGVVARPEGHAWTVAPGDAPAAVDAFFACAREPAETDPEDLERLAADEEDGDADRLSYEAWWEDGALVVGLTRQFALVADDEDQASLDRLFLEVRTTAVAPGTPAAGEIAGTGGAGAEAWERRVRADAAFAAALAAPADAVLFDQSPV